MTLPLEWSPWREWTPRDDNSIPDEVQPGVRCEAEVAFRIGHRRWPHSEMQTFVIQDGTSWMAYPPAGSHPDLSIVTRYRIRRPRPMLVTETAEELLEA